MAASRPREAVAVAEILRAQGAPAWEPRVEAQLLELSYRHVADLLDEAAQYAAHRSRDAPVTQADVRLAAQSALTHAFTDPLGGEELACIVARLNEAPLPDVPVRHGIVYPNESNLLATNFQVLAKPQVPSQTVFCSNLSGKTKKQELKRALHLCFTAYGRVLDVVCLKTPKLRGQAWVVFADVPSATNALRALQGAQFYDRPLRLAFALGKSDVVSKADGSWLPKDKRAAGAARQARGARGEEHEEEEAGAPSGQPGSVLAEAGPPNQILFVQGLPATTTQAMLVTLFQQFPGFSEVRLVEARPGIAFVEFDSELQAGVALSGLAGFKLTAQDTLGITFAKKDL